MKRFYLLGVLCTLLSFNVFGQYIPAYQPQISIIDIQWNATPETINYQNLVGTLPPSFHAVRLNVQRSNLFNFAVKEYECNIDITQLGGDLASRNKPIVLLFHYNTDYGVEPIMGERGLKGFTITKDNIGSVSGLSTAAVVIGRRSVAPMHQETCMKIDVLNGTTITFNENEINFPNYSNTRCQVMPREGQIEDKISVYPNPAQDKVFVNATNSDILEINFRSLQGEVLDHKVSTRHGTEGAQINTAQLTPGVYIIQVKTETETTTQKILIQRK